MSSLETTTSTISGLVSPTFFLIALILTGICTLCRWVLLPKPLRGIPYDRAATKKLLGDMPALRSDPDGLAAWCSKQLAKLKTPICQAFMGPNFFQNPIVLVADVGEARNILLGQSDFDRSSYITKRFPLFGDFHLNMKTTEDWKLARHWSKDLLTPQYLNGVANPAIELATQRLIELWDGKNRLANGRAFDMIRDVKGLSIDIILAFYFGDDMTDSILSRETQHVEQLDRSKLAIGDDSEIIFPRAKLHDFCEGLIHITHKIVSLYTTPWPPALAAWWTRYVSLHFRRYFASKDNFVRQLLARAVQRTQGNEEPKIKSGIDHIVWREGKAAIKTGRKPKYGKQVMVDETFGALVAGQHTTSASIVWILKYLADYPIVQAKLREEVQAVCAEAAREKRLPTADEVVQSLKELPYLRAVIEEMLRLRQAMLVPRDATRDTELLGCRIPKGTVVLLVCQGPDPSTLRSVDGKPVHVPRQYPGNGSKDLEMFDPERWLVRKSTGEVEFDGTTYPQLAFGGGVRACWGRKLAELEMQIVTVMLVWKFDFLRVPEALATHKATYDITYQANKGYLKVRSRDM